MIIFFFYCFSIALVMRICFRNNLSILLLYCLDDVQCTGHEHNGFTSLDDIFYIPVDRMYELLFTDSQMYKDFIAARKTYGVYMDFFEAPVHHCLGFLVSYHSRKFLFVIYSLSINLDEISIVSVENSDIPAVWVFHTEHFRSKVFSQANEALKVF